MEKKDGKKPQCPTYLLCNTCEKRTIQLKDVGKALALTCVPRGHRQNRKIQRHQTLRESQKEQATQRLLTQVNPTPKRLIQKTNFATTPIT